MKYGLEQGKWFITGAIFLSQVNMAYCDTVTDALSAQASKHGIRDAHENLQYVEMISQAFGGVTGCLLAAAFQQSAVLNKPQNLFGVYIGLQVVLFLSAFLLN